MFLRARWRDAWNRRQQAIRDAAKGAAPPRGQRIPGRGVVYNADL
jgi:hypothetical protein